MSEVKEFYRYAPDAERAIEYLTKEINKYSPEAEIISISHALTIDETIDANTKYIATALVVYK